jgi:predicted O-methyltransferase YrrM
MSKTATREQYELAYDLECRAQYPEIDGLEAELGFAVDRNRLNDAARDLACPVKRNPPHWAHGRVLYAVARDYLKDQPPGVMFLDIGTAKGFSAVVMAWALEDAGHKWQGRIVSLDVTSPVNRVARNSVAEIDGLKTVPEFVAPYMPEDTLVDFLGMSSLDYLQMSSQRIHFAFVDGKHDYEHVNQEAAIITTAQMPGDIIVFDDLQVPGVAKVVKRLQGYDVNILRPLPHRSYAVARKA